MSGDDETRIRSFCRDRVAVLGFTTTYKYAGTAKVRVSRTRHQMLWVGLWVGKSGYQTPAHSQQRSSIHARFQVTVVIAYPKLNLWKYT